ncbi:MAG: hypothetical protein ACE5K3_09325 [bacterium]
MDLIDRIIEQIEQLSLLIFGQKVDIGYFESGRRLIRGLSWQAVIVPAMAYEPHEDVFLLEEENLAYLFSNLFNYDRQRKIILSMLAHEMRHRVQCQIPETILWTEDDPLLKDRKDVQEKAKRFKKYLQQYYSRETHSMELDARIISYLVASEANESLEHIADLIHYGPLALQSFPDWLYFL